MKTIFGMPLVPGLHTGLIEMTIPDKPNSRLQKYRLTPAARHWRPRTSNRDFQPNNRIPPPAETQTSEQPKVTLRLLIPAKK